MNAYFNVAIYGPVLQDQAKFKAFDGNNPILAGLLDLVAERHGAGLSGRLQRRLSPTSRPTSSSRRWCSASSSTAGTSTRPWTRRRRRRRRSTTSTSRPLVAGGRPQAPASKAMSRCSVSDASAGPGGSLRRRARDAAAAAAAPGRAGGSSPTGSSLPVVLLLVGLVAYPFLYAIFVSFTDRVVGNAGEWIGFDNFRYLAQLAGFHRARSGTPSSSSSCRDVLKLADRARPRAARQPAPAAAGASSARS